jgi:hypothetical protein
MDANQVLLKAILATVARTTFPPNVLYKLVAPTAGSDKQLVAYNLCNGETPQVEIGKKAELDQGSLSRSIARWIEAGIMVRVGDERLPLHLYPVAKPSRKAGASNG